MPDLPLTGTCSLVGRPRPALSRPSANASRISSFSRPAMRKPGLRIPNDATVEWFLVVATEEIDLPHSLLTVVAAEVAVSIPRLCSTLMFRRGIAASQNCRSMASATRRELRTVGKNSLIAGETFHRRTACSARCSLRRRTLSHAPRPISLGSLAGQPTVFTITEVARMAATALQRRGLPPRTPAWVGCRRRTAMAFRWLATRRRHWRPRTSRPRSRPCASGTP